MREMRMLHEVMVQYKPTFKVDDLETLRSSRDAEKYLRKIWEDDLMYRERMYVLLLNNASKIIGFNLVSIGGSAGTVVDTKLVLQTAILTNATYIILAHNHPGGTLKPSNQDSDITENVKSACKYFHIELLDHIILTQERYYSFADEGLL